MAKIEVKAEVRVDGEEQLQAIQKSFDDIRKAADNFNRAFSKIRNRRRTIEALGNAANQAVPKFDKLTASTTRLAESMENLRKPAQSVRRALNNMIPNMRLMTLFAERMRVISQQTRKIQKDYKDLAESTRKFRDAMRNSEQRMEKFVNTAARFGGTMAAVSTSIKMATNSTRALNYAAAGLSKTIQEENIVMTSSANRMERLAGMISLYRWQFIILATTISGFGLKITRTFTELEESLARVFTNIPDPDRFRDIFSERVIDISSRYARSSKEVADSLFLVVSSGIEASRATTFLESAVRLATAGFADMSAVVDVLTSIVNAYGFTAEEVTNISDRLFRAQVLGKTTIEELARALGDVIPMAAQFGVTLNEVLSSVVALTQVGVSTDKAAVQIRSLIEAITNPSSMALKVIQKYGLERFSATGLQVYGLRGVIEELRNVMKEFPEFDAQLKPLLGRIEAMNAALALSGPLWARWGESMGKIKDSSGDVNEALEEVRNKVSFQVKKAFEDLRNSVTRAGEAIGEDVANNLRTYAEAVDRLASALESMDPQTRRLMVNVASLTTVFLGFMAVLGFLAGPWRTLSRLIRPFVARIGGARGAIRGLTAGLSALGSVLSSVASQILRLLPLLLKLVKYATPIGLFFIPSRIAPSTIDEDKYLRERFASPDVLRETGEQLKSSRIGQQLQLLTNKLRGFIKSLDDRPIQQLSRELSRAFDPERVRSLAPKVSQAMEKIAKHYEVMGEAVPSQYQLEGLKKALDDAAAAGEDMAKAAQEWISSLYRHRDTLDRAADVQRLVDLREQQVERLGQLVSQVGIPQMRQVREEFGIDQARQFLRGFVSGALDLIEKSEDAKVEVDNLVSELRKEAAVSKILADAMAELSENQSRVELSAAQLAEVLSGNVDRIFVEGRRVIDQFGVSFGRTFINQLYSGLVDLAEQGELTSESIAGLVSNLRAQVRAQKSLSDIVSKVTAPPGGMPFEVEDWVRRTVLSRLRKVAPDREVLREIAPSAISRALADAERAWDELGRDSEAFLEALRGILRSIVENIEKTLRTQKFVSEQVPEPPPAPEPVPPTRLEVTRTLIENFSGLAEAARKAGASGEEFQNALQFTQTALSKLESASELTADKVSELFNEFLKLSQALSELDRSVREASAGLDVPSGVEIPRESIIERIRGVLVRAVREGRITAEEGTNLFQEALSKSEEDLLRFNRNLKSNISSIEESDKELSTFKIMLSDISGTIQYLNNVSDQLRGSQESTKSAFDSLNESLGGAERAIRTFTSSIDRTAVSLAGRGDAAGVIGSVAAILSRAAVGTKGEVLETAALSIGRFARAATEGAGPVKRGLGAAVEAGLPAAAYAAAAGAGPLGWAAVGLVSVGAFIAEMKDAAEEAKRAAEAARKEWEQFVDQIASRFMGLVDIIEESITKGFTGPQASQAIDQFIQKLLWSMIAADILRTLIQPKVEQVSEIIKQQQKKQYYVMNGVLLTEEQSQRYLGTGAARRGGFEGPYSLVQLASRTDVVGEKARKMIQENTEALKELGDEIGTIVETQGIPLLQGIWEGLGGQEGIDFNVVGGGGARVTTISGAFANKLDQLRVAIVSVLTDIRDILSQMRDSGSGLGQVQAAPGKKIDVFGDVNIVIEGVPEADVADLVDRQLGELI